MIKIPHPAMTLNTAGFYEYQMWNTRLVAPNVTPHWLINNVASVAANAPGGKLSALIFLCHGFVDEKGEFLGLHIGTGIHFKNLKEFSKLRNLVDSIYITACQAANGKGGQRFCRELARQAQAIVYAGDSNQITTPLDIGRLKPGVIDAFEGQVYRFGISGDSSSVDLSQPVEN
ncbi:MAG: hypothetical protein ABJA66_04350 [Actinomycetota bacterium]